MNIANFCGGFWDFIKRNEEDFLFFCICCFFLMTLFLQGGIGFSPLFKDDSTVFLVILMAFVSSSLSSVWYCVYLRKTNAPRSKLFTIYKFFVLYIFLRLAVFSNGTAMCYRNAGRAVVFLCTILSARVLFRIRKHTLVFLFSLVFSILVYVRYFRTHTHTYGWSSWYFIQSAWHEPGSIAILGCFLDLLLLFFEQQRITNKLRAFLIWVQCLLLTAGILLSTGVPERFNIIMLWLSTLGLSLVIRKKRFLCFTFIVLVIYWACHHNIIYDIKGNVLSKRCWFFGDRLKCLGRIKNMGRSDYLIGNFSVNSKHSTHHNAYLTLMFSYGFPALIIYLIGIGYFYWIIFKNRKNLNSFSVFATVFVTFILLSLNGKGNYCSYPFVFFLMFYLEYYFQKKLYLSSKPSHEVPTV